MGDYSAITYEFHREKADADCSSLYTSVRNVRDIPPNIDNKRLRSLVAEYIRKNSNLHTAVLERGTKCKTVDEYCSQIVKGTLCGGQPEIQALANISGVLIYVVSMTKTSRGNLDIRILNYGTHEKPGCVYILYDDEKQHFDPLYLINKQNPKEICKDFQRDDKATLELLYKFIREELHFVDDGFVGLDQDEPMYETELSTATTLLHETENLSELITPNAISAQPKTSKIPNHEELSLSQNIQEKSPPSAPVNVVNESGDDNNCNPMAIEQYLQKNPCDDEYVVMTEDSPVVSNGTIRFEYEPVLEFRGRTDHEFKPKKPLKRSGQPSVPRSPRYFSDLRNNHFLNLLISKEILLPGVEYRCKICLITRKINECSYYHPYFKFQIHPTDTRIRNENSVYITVNDTNLKDYDEGIKNLILQLVVVMHTNPELMESEQPLPIFSSSNIGSPIVDVFDTHKSFKAAYHLQELRFAVTLESRQPGEQGFRRHDDIQYISQVSKEDKKAKVPINH